jgi:hypothetical protein
MPATSVHAVCDGLRSVGIKPNQGIGITEDLLDARSLFLPPNTTTVYVFTCLDLKDEPIVLEVPPAALGPVAGAVRNVTANAKVYPLNAATESGEPPGTSFVNTSGMKFNTVSANTFLFYDELNAVVQTEPADFVDPDTVGLFAAIGIKKGKPFAPDARMKALLTDAIAVANGYARANVFASRVEGAKAIRIDSGLHLSSVAATCSWTEPSACSMPATCSSTWQPESPRRCRCHGLGRDLPMHDPKGDNIDGSKVTLPAPVPAKEFWSFVVYDNQTRSLLETDQKSAGVDSTAPGLQKNQDG